MHSEKDKTWEAFSNWILPRPQKHFCRGTWLWISGSVSSHCLQGWEGFVYKSSCFSQWEEINDIKQTQDKNLHSFIQHTLLHFVMFIRLDFSSLAVNESCVSSHSQTTKNIQGWDTDQCGDCINRIPLKLITRSSISPHPNFPRKWHWTSALKKREPGMDNTDESFNKEMRPWRRQTLFQGQWKTIWKSDSYWIVLDLRIALCTLHQLGGERWLDWRGSRDIRKMGPVMDACGRLREKPQASPCSRAVQTLALCMVECWRNPDIPKLKEKGERGGKRREGGGRGGGGGGNHHQLPCCMSQAPNHSL
jgi:hypothetical protein